MVPSIRKGHRGEPREDSGNNEHETTSNQKASTEANGEASSGKQIHRKISGERVAIFQNYTEHRTLRMGA